MGHQFENDLVKKVHRDTDSRIRTYRCGYSGNNAFPQPDFLVTTETENFAVEVKGPIQKDRCYVDEEHIEQLVRCRNTTTTPALAVRFQNREMLVVRYFHQVPQIDGYDEMSPVEKFAALVPSAFEPNVTPSGNLSLKKPDMDDWPSARAGSRDVLALLSGLGVPTPESTEVEM